MGFADGDQLREFPSAVESVSAWTQRMEETQSPSSPPQSTPFSSLFSLVAATSKAGRGTGELRRSLTCTKAPWLAQSSHSFTSPRQKRKKAQDSPKGPVLLGRSQEIPGAQSLISHPSSQID